MADRFGDSSREYMRRNISFFRVQAAMFPMMTMLAGFAAAITLFFGGRMVIGGAMFIETVFNIPGIGRLAVNSVTSQDYPYVQAITLLVASFVVLVNLIVDIAYGWLDPRIRYG